MIPIRGTRNTGLGCKVFTQVFTQCMQKRIWNQVALGHRPLAELLAKMVPSAAGL